MLNVNLNATNQSLVTPPSTTAAQESTLPEPVLTLLNDSTTLEAPYSPETLQTQLQQQKAAARSTADDPRNKESDISDSLLDAINQSAEDLSVLQGWTDGGSGMFNAANKVMFEALKEAVQSNDSTKKGFALEDLFQLAVIDFMANSASKTDQAMKDKLAHYLESTGSGSHGVHENWNGQKFADELQSVWDHIKTHAPEDSLSKNILNYLETQAGGIDQLKIQYSTNFDARNGYAFRNNYDKENFGLSPMLRLAVMAKFLTKKPDIVQADLEKLMIGTFKEMEDIITKHFGSETVENLLTDGNSNDWQIINASGTTDKIVDWNGTGLDLQYFKDLYTKFPSRVLGDEDIKEINRIGDNVKMIQQTLKYWYHILRDERLSIARNI
ncbi:TPA: molecular chaperone [Vibrio parahaemolyticus]|uniref:molecular chaperone n=1 Tax=Vibrio parahaemolyticus TaxID=670 RepID=UPI001EF771EB|nr:molecular chaperone [Vibrio parahaemolyticus]MCG7779054.1 molecular chaperone [Vibrio parahaemolyticus]HCH4208717.1 molecular chaperone [Vibrio parahaemolyticus]HCH6055236.1 molecular chaperone [Vibrio parahaemolyticus]HCM1470571.1 molecular chaperone [Vibrio parahaemolyticus]HCM1529532.1 molecular chaperone [Vibrio parahaemolyticus]